MPKLKSVDLFSGIGGWVQALDGITTPTMFCDCDPRAVETLNRIMDRGAFPRVPIITDVRKLGEIVQTVKGMDIDVVTASSPCVGWSAAGSHKGLENEHSALFHDAAKVIAALKPKIAIFENVANILSESFAGDMQDILKTLKRIGYGTIRWTVCSAADVGAPHLRKRWFCLATLNGADMPDIDFSGVPLHDWAESFPAVTIKSDENKATIVRRGHLLGNAIVPLAARVAFARMYSGFKLQTVEDVRAAGVVKFVRDSDLAGGQSVPAPANHGYVAGKRALKYFFMPVAPVSHKYLEITLDPENQYTTPEGHVKRIVPGRAVSPSHLTPFTKRMWPTPRAGVSTHSHVLSHRTADDLPTVAVFASKVGDKAMPKTNPATYVNAEFVEWLMGYPAGHTL